jgi:hypothetical protein
VVDLAPGPAEAWWVLTGGPAPGLLALAPDLAIRRRVALPAQPQALASVPDGATAWVWSAQGARAYDGRGRERGRLDAPPRQPLVAFLARHGGAVAALEGAVLALDETGRVRATQGGFAAVGGLAWSGGRP